MGRAKAREKTPLHMAGCMLYWAEGAKRNAAAVRLINADPNMIKLFVRFLREELKVKDELINVSVQCHTIDTVERERIKQYWLDLLDLPETNFRSMRTKVGSNKHFRTNKFPNGFCLIEVYRLQVLHHILGAIQEYGDFDNHEWGYRL